MIRANHNKYWVKFSNYYAKALIAVFFRSVTYSGQYEEKGLPILMISNHFSFYDGFIQILLNFKILFADVWSKGVSGINTKYSPKLEPVQSIKAGVQV